MRKVILLWSQQVPSSVHLLRTIGFLHEFVQSICVDDQRVYQMMVTSSRVKINELPALLVPEQQQLAQYEGIQALQKADSLFRNYLSQGQQSYGQPQQYPPGAQVGYGSAGRQDRRQEDRRQRVIGVSQEDRRQEDRQEEPEHEYPQYMEDVPPEALSAIRRPKVETGEIRFVMTGRREDPEEATAPPGTHVSDGPEGIKFAIAERRVEGDDDDDEDPHGGRKADPMSGPLPNRQDNEQTGGGDRNGDGFALPPEVSERPPERPPNDSTDVNRLQPEASAQSQQGVYQTGQYAQAAIDHYRQYAQYDPSTQPPVTGPNLKTTNFQKVLEAARQSNRDHTSQENRGNVGRPAAS